MKYPVAFPDGHFYSPVPGDEAIDHVIATRQANPPLPGIELNLEQQKKIYHQLKQFEAEYPWQEGEQPQPGLHYCYPNSQFSRCCSYPLYAFLRLLKPRRIVEIGAGYSTGVIVDTNRLFLGNRADLVSIEPYPDRLRELFGNDFSDCGTLLEQCLQKVDPEVILSLEAGDILFVDSSHVAKLDSDVLLLLFELLPRLNPGVIIHFHDVPFPFEYYDYWLRENRAWNEAYLLRAFLQYNNVFSILYWGSCLVTLAPELGESDLGGSIWLKKVR